MSVTQPRRLFRPALLALAALLALTPLLSGCLTRSENVGDLFSGVVVVAASPATGPTPPTFDVPASLSGAVAVYDFPETDDGSAPATDGPAGDKTGSRLRFTDLTTGQFSQLGDIIASALPDGNTVDLSASRSGDIVRLRGGTNLTALPADNYFVSITVEFAGPIVATNGQQGADDSVTWTPPGGGNAEFIADAEYADPATAAVPSWTWFVVIIALLVVLLIAWLAYMTRDRSPRPGRPRQVRETGDVVRDAVKSVVAKTTGHADGPDGDTSTSDDSTSDASTSDTSTKDGDASDSDAPDRDASDRDASDGEAPGTGTADPNADRSASADR